MVNKKQIAIAMAQGKSNPEIAQELGVGPSYISQLRNDDNFMTLVSSLSDTSKLLEGEYETAEEVEERKAKKAMHTALDDAYDLIEEHALGKLVDRMSMGLVTKTSELIQVAKLANTAIRKTNVAEQQLVNSGPTLIQVNMGPVLLNKVTQIETKVNRNNQVIEVGDQTVVNRNKSHIIEDLNAIQGNYTKALEAGHSKHINDISASDL